MKETKCEDFQKTVAQYTIRHKSLLDILSKIDEAASKVHRATIKSVTQCGCVTIEAKKHSWHQELNLLDLGQILDDHLSGKLCDDCQEIVESEIGKLLFYITALCNTLNLDLDEILTKENKKVLTLGRFNLT